MKRSVITVPGAAACLALTLAASAGPLSPASAQDQPAADSAPQIGTLSGPDAAVPPGWYFLPLRGPDGGPYSPASPLPLRAIVHVPAGSATHEGTLVGPAADGGTGASRLSVVTDIARVDTEPCGGGMLVDPGPSAEDLAAALAPHAVAPARAVTVDGYDGFYFQVDTPEDVSQCPGGIYRLMDDRAERTPGSSRLWILDVEGYRVVATVTSPQQGASDPDPTAAMAESLLFVRTRAPH